MFEIFLKDDFLDLYLRPDYELRVGGHVGNQCGHSHTNSSIHQSPGKNSTFSGNITVDRTSSPHKGRPASPGKIRNPNGENHDMTPNEIRERYLIVEDGQHHTNL